MPKDLIPPAAAPVPQGKLPPKINPPVEAATGPGRVNIARKDSQAFGRRTTQHWVPPALQKETITRIFKLGKVISDQDKIPVVVVDHRQAGIDDYPIIHKAFAAFVKKHKITELLDVDAALRKGTLKYLPGYTSQASDHWRATHQALASKYKAAFGKMGTRIDIGFMSYPVHEANAAAGLLEFDVRYKIETGGVGQIVFCGAGTGKTGAHVKGGVDEFRQVYTRPREQGGGGLIDPDVRFGEPEPSPEAWERAKVLAAEYEHVHPMEGPLPLDDDTRAKAGWVETIERESGHRGREKVVIAFIDDRAHNRVGAQAAGKLGQRMLAVKAVPPGLSYSQADNFNENQISTFHPNPV